MACSVASCCHFACGAQTVASIAVTVKAGVKSPGFFCCFTKGKFRAGFTRPVNKGLGMLQMSVAKPEAVCTQVKAPADGRGSCTDASRIGSDVRMVSLFPRTGSHAFPNPMFTEPKPLSPIPPLSGVCRPEAVSLRAMKCFRVGQKFGQQKPPFHLTE
jgi:hypothetical protein